MGDSSSLIGKALGPYLVVAKIGAGGMGEVYRARDARLGRDVAIKILPAAFCQDQERMRRFEQEARAAAALTHPNILAIYDFGLHQGVPYIVSELLEGESLRQRLRGDALPTRLAMDYAIQIANGLTGAHAKHVVHRDMKPDNLFVTKEGSIKILDFGLAKLTQPVRALTDSGAVTTGTLPGTIMGTIEYMSPEQLRGRPADHRSDIFSFGMILYEMLAGKNPFRGETTADTVSAILKQDAPRLAERREPIPPRIERIVQRCLEKDPGSRFQSASDLAFDLAELSGFGQTISGVTPPVDGRKRTWWPLLVGAALLAAVAAAAWIFVGARGTKTGLVYQRLTLQRGTVWSARFEPDGDTIIYSASWNGKPMDIYNTRYETPESRSLGLENAQLLAISSAGEMAILVKRKLLSHHLSRGTLAQIPLMGGTPREIMADVQQADWDPGGAGLAVVHEIAGGSRLEFPPGKALYEPAGWVSYPRFSPQGNLIAFLEHPVLGDSRGWVSLVDLKGKRKVLTEEWAGEEGLAWSPDGEEVWFTANKSGGANTLYGVTRAGKLRVLASAPVNLVLDDVSRGGNAILSVGNEASEFVALPPGEKKETDLSSLDWGAIRDLSPDGRTLILSHFGERSGPNYSVYLCRTDGSAAVRLGDGSGWALSPDGKWVISILANPPQIVLLPTGAGETQRLQRGGIEEYGLGASWFPDGKRILFVGREPGHAARTYWQSIEGGPPHPMTPEGISGTLLSPDGQTLLAADSHQNKALYPVLEGKPRPVPGLEAEDRVVRWSADGHSLYIYRETDLPIRIYLLDVSTGRRKLWKALMPSDSLGIRELKPVLLTPDGECYAYGLTRSINSLYLLRGLR